MSKIKNNLAKYRNWKNITQQGLADELKMSVKHLRNIEVNNNYPNYVTRAKLCKYFNVSQDQMFYYESEEE